MLVTNRTILNDFFEQKVFKFLSNKLNEFLDSYVKMSLFFDCLFQKNNNKFYFLSVHVFFMLDIVEIELLFHFHNIFVVCFIFCVSLISVERFFWILMIDFFSTIAKTTIKSFFVRFATILIIISRSICVKTRCSSCYATYVFNWLKYWNLKTIETLTLKSSNKSRTKS